ncbi:MAG: hypothetical protein ACJAVD_001037, partial [Porticoccaceae bacterium]
KKINVKILFIINKIYYNIYDKNVYNYLKWPY